MANDNGIILYQDENGITRVSVRFSDEDLWLTQNQIAEIYDTTQQNISQHIDGVLKDGELPEVATHKKFLLVQTEGNRQVRREISHYNLDMIIAKNYLSELELTRLNLLVSQFLDFAEFQALEQKPMSTRDWIAALDNQIIAMKREVLQGHGGISREQAFAKAEKEFEIYRAREMKQLESDFDKAVKLLSQNKDAEENSTVRKSRTVDNRGAGE
jgi:hypothetical protein